MDEGEPLTEPEIEDWTPHSAVVNSDPEPGLTRPHPRAASGPFRGDILDWGAMQASPEATGCSVFRASVAVRPTAGSETGENQQTRAQ